MGKEKLVRGHIGAVNFFRGLEVKSNFHKGIQVKISRRRPTAGLFSHSSTVRRGMPSPSTLLEK